jgi:hypothetical protein
MGLTVVLVQRDEDRRGPAPLGAGNRFPRGRMGCEPGAHLIQ